MKKTQLGWDHVTTTPSRSLVVVLFFFSFSQSSYIFFPCCYYNNNSATDIAAANDSNDDDTVHDSPPLLLAWSEQPQNTQNHAKITISRSLLIVFADFGSICYCFVVGDDLDTISCAYSTLKRFNGHVDASRTSLQTIKK